MTDDPPINEMGDDTPIQIEDIVEAKCENGTILKYRAIREISPNRSVYTDGKREEVTIDEYEQNRYSLETATSLVSKVDRWIVTPTNEQIKIRNDEFYLISHVRAFDGLWEKIGGFEITDDESLIPVSVAVDGKPAIATYLKTVHQLPSTEISGRMGISSRTIRQYLAGISGDSR